MCTIAAATSFNSPFVPRERFHTKLSHAQRSFAGTRWSDHINSVCVNQKFAEQVEYGPQAESTFCMHYSLSNTVLSMSQEAKKQLHSVLTQSGFPEECFLSYSLDPRSNDLNLDLFLSMLIIALYPNVCHLRTDRKRAVYTLEQATALMSKSSVCIPFNNAEKIDFPSPLFVFTEKVCF